MKKIAENGKFKKILWGTIMVLFVSRVIKWIKER